MGLETKSTFDMRTEVQVLPCGENLVSVFHRDYLLSVGERRLQMHAGVKPWRFNLSGQLLPSNLYDLILDTLFI